MRFAHRKIVDIYIHEHDTLFRNWNQYFADTNDASSQILPHDTLVLNCGLIVNYFPTSFVCAFCYRYWDYHLVPLTVRLHLA